MRRSSIVSTILSTALLGVLFGTQGCGPMPESSSPQGIIPGVPGESPVLAMGFDLAATQLTGTRCFDGGRIVDRSGEGAELRVERNLGYDALNKIFNGKVSLSIPIFPGINATGSAGFASQASSSRYAETISLVMQAQVMNRRLYLDDASSLTLKPRVSRLRELIPPTSQDNAKNLQDHYRAMCGQEYISSVDYGMTLVATLKASFANEYDKKAFSGAIGVDVLGGIAKGELSAEFEEIASQRNINISLNVMQKGGDPRLLLDILGASSTQNDGLFLQCDQSNFRHCADVFREVTVVARKISDSVNRSESGIPNPIPLVHQTMAYPTNGPLREISAAGPSPIDLAAMRATAQLVDRQRQSLMNLYGQTIADQDRLQLVRSRLNRLGSHDLEVELQGIEKSIQERLERIAQAEKACRFSFKIGEEIDTDPCVQAVAEASDLSYDRAALSLTPKQFTDWCFYAHFDRVISPQEENTVSQIMATLGHSLLSREDGETEWASHIERHCGQAESILREVRFLNLDRSDGDRPPITTLLPIASLDQLEQVSARNQQLSRVEGLVPLKNLRDLDLAGNYFATLAPFGEFQSENLDRLNLSANQIESVKMEAPLKWRRLNLRRNVITSLEQFAAPSLQELDLSHNSIGIEGGWENLDPTVSLRIESTGIRCADLTFSECKDQKDE